MLHIIYIIIIFSGSAAQYSLWPPHITRFLDLTRRHASWYDSSGQGISLSQRPLPDNRQTSMPPMGFKPTIAVGERPWTYALDRTVTGTSY
jgi:hypothetical protein